MEIREADLLIRPAISTDVNTIVTLWNDPSATKPCGYPNGAGTTPETIRKTLADSDDEVLLNSFLVVKRGDVCIGLALMHSPDSEGKSSIDIDLFPEWRGKGFGATIKRILLTHMFQNTSCRYVEARPSLDNFAGIHLEESVGGVRVGRGRFQPRSGAAATPTNYWIYRVYRDSAHQIDCRNRQTTYSAIIPAAGESSRMGRCKHLLPWPPHSVDSGYCVIECAIQSLMHAGVDPIIVVIGYWKDRIRRRLADWPVTLVENPDFRSPMSRSVTLALPKIPTQSALLVLPGDHPAVNSDTIRHLITLHEQSPGKIHIPVFNLRGGHPTLFSPETFPEMLRSDLAEGLRSIIQNPKFEVVRAPVLDSGVCKNVDTPEDYDSGEFSA